MKVRNTHRVQKKQWAKWSERARGVFNAVYATMADQLLFLHPEGTQNRGEHWKTTRWNAAWVAADAVDGFETKVER